MNKDAGAGATNLIIFGISGDLSHRYLLPALAQLDREGLLPAGFRVTGLSRQPLSTDDVLPKNCRRLAKFLNVVQLDPLEPEGYKKLAAGLSGAAQNIFYLVVPPRAVLPIVHNLGRAGLNTKKSKLLLEKPFGTDLESARSLVSEIKNYFAESQVYRIDHYLAKEAAQNIAIFLGSNAVFREVWNNRFIEYVEIVASEKIGLANRTELWETTGSLRDFVQSHMLQLAALTAMRPCDNFEDFERLPALRLGALKKFSADSSRAVRGQYEGYRAEAGNPESASETFAALTLSSSDPRWRGVPFYLATGKKLDQKLTEIRIQFKKISTARPNRLVLRIQPKEGIEFDLWVKQPGPKRELNKLSLDFSYSQHFKRLPDAYEQVLIDVINSNHSLFASSAEVLESWRILQPILDMWARTRKEPVLYKPGSTIEQVLAKAV